MKSFYRDGWGRGLNRRPLPQAPSSLDTTQAILSWQVCQLQTVSTEGFTPENTSAKALK
jgi:hypothetical protein